MQCVVVCTGTSEMRQAQRGDQFGAIGPIDLSPALGLENNAAVSRTWVNPYNNISLQREAKHTRILKCKSWIFSIRFFYFCDLIPIFFLLYHTAPIPDEDSISKYLTIKLNVRFVGWLMVFNATFNNISVISWWSVL